MEILTQSGKYNIFVDKDYNCIPELTGKRNCIFITDENVYSLYPKIFEGKPVIVVKPGETSKNLSTFGNIIRKMTEFKVDRDWILIAAGGGVVTDLGGFVASVYRRGIKFGFVSTSLLGQVDASSGGKNGINSDNFKNYIGTFNIPEFVVCETGMLQTLPRYELINGMAEAIKHGLIFDAEYLNFAVENRTKILQYDQEILKKIVSRSLEIKAEFVSKDINEKGIRKILNFGHTFGHIIETEYKIGHGYAVAYGILAADEISRQLFGFKDQEKIKQILFDFYLLPKIKLDFKKIANLIYSDKKCFGDFTDFILLEKIGKAFIHSIKTNELKKIAEKINL